MPLAFAAPDEPGTYELLVDVLQERRRWFGAEATIPVAVRRRRQAVVLLGQPPGDDAYDRQVEEVLAGIDASLEPVLVGPQEDWLRDRFGTGTASEPPVEAAEVFVVPAGPRRQQLRLIRQAARLRPREQRRLGTLRYAMRAALAIVLG